MRLPADARGFSLIEVMVALALGALLSIGIVSLFGATSKSNKVQTQLARLQETGRYVTSRVIDDLRMTNAQYCSNTGGLAQKQTYEFQDGTRTPMVYTTAFKLPDLTAAIPPMAGNAYPMPSRLFSRGYECNGTSCSPSLPASVLPKMGTTAGDRAAGADVLTLRYLAGGGWSVGENGSSQECNSVGELTKLTIVPKSTDRDLSTFNSDGLALLADCSSSEVIKLNRSAGVFTPNSSGNVIAPKCVSTSTDARLFDFQRDFVTVSYYLKLVPDAARPGRVISALMRRVNGGDATVGGVDEELALGVERLDFRYGVEDANGATVYLTADQVDKGDKGASKGAIDCPPPPQGVDPTADQGCLWRAVKNIEVHLLLNTVDDMGLSVDEMKYQYSEDGDTAPRSPDATLKSGLAPGKMMRREFSAVVALRNYNP